MEPWASSDLPYGDDRAKNVDIMTVNKEGIGNANSMFVGRSRARPLDLLELPRSHKRRAKKGSGSWWNDPEMKRRRRVAKYKLYSAEGKIKSSVKHGIRWIKQKCSEIARRF